MKSLNEVMIDASANIDAEIDKVTARLRKVLKKAGIPEEICNKYYAVSSSGGEWILDDGKELAAQDVHLFPEEGFVSVVKEIEGIN